MRKWGVLHLFVREYGAHFGGIAEENLCFAGGRNYCAGDAHCKSSIERERLY
jgi:hypothetical protein